jgi:transglutaminase-like putative cysteine protease
MMDVDLYRLVRISIYLMAASGAFSLSVAEGNLSYLFAVLIFGGLAYATVDSKRVRPVRLEYACAMALALLLYTLLPLRKENGWETEFPAAFAHFLCALQVLLFFTAYKGPVLLTFCGSTLAIVITSGVMQPDVSLVARMACFIAVTSWTLFVHSLWRAREAYNFQATAAPASAGSAGGLSGNPDHRLLPERAIWQGIFLSVGLAATCLVLGFVLFFSAPRINESMSSVIDLWPRENTQDPGTSKLPGMPGRGNGRPDQGPSIVGWNKEVSLNSIGVKSSDNRLAFSVTLPSASAGIASPDGRVYFRGAVLSEHRDEKWIAADNRQLLEAGDNPAGIKIIDASVTGLLPASSDVKQRVEIMSVLSNEYFALGTITRINERKAVVDPEGAVRAPNSANIEGSYEVTSRLPVFPDSVPADADCDHDDRQRYVKNTGLSAVVLEDVRRLALQITDKNTKSIEKVRSIMAHLHDKKRYKYDLKGDTLLNDFLLSKDEKKRRGRCSHFAASFVILCRLNNIPARMATGFATVVKPADLIDGAVLNIRNTEAHAWGEVFFKGIGWVTFDPTPPGTPEEVTPDIASKPPDVPVDPLNKLPAIPQRGRLTQAWERVLAYDSRDQRALYQRFTDALGSGAGGAKAVLTGGGYGGWIGALLAWVLVGATTYWLIAIFLRRGGRRMHIGGHAGRNSRAAIAFYNDLLQVLSRRGFVRKPGQTPREFAEFVVRRGGESFKPVLVVTEVFENVRYGGNDLSQDEFNRLQNSLDSLRDLSFVAGALATK